MQVHHSLAGCRSVVDTNVEAFRCEFANQVIPRNVEQGKEGYSFFGRESEE